LEYRIGAGVMALGGAMNPDIRAVLVGLIVISAAFALLIGLYYAR
jgi:hypothetical protein